MADGGKEIHRQIGDAEVTVDVADEDRYTVVVGRIRASRTDGASVVPKAPDVAAGIPYLLEPLRVLEGTPDEAIVRSDRPADKDGSKQFYELRFKGSDMTMERKAAKDGEATAQPFAVPSETLDRLVDDLGRMLG